MPVVAFGQFIKITLAMAEEKQTEHARHLLEKEETTRVIQKGIDFTIRDKKAVVKRRWFGLRRTTTVVDTVMQFHIHECTLATLDRISAESIEFVLDNDMLADVDNKEAAKRHANGMVGRHSKRCARVVAIAALGESLWKPEGQHGHVQWREDSKLLDETTELFMRALRPSTLLQLFNAVYTMCNLGDFLNAIRLMQTDRTTMPNRIAK